MGEESACDCKIGRVSDTYGLAGLRSEVERLRDEGLSLRDLATEVNVRITDAVLSGVEADVVGDGESIYAALTDDSVDPERQVAIRNQLVDAGVNVDRLVDDFVTYQAVRRHLRNCLDVDTSRSGVETVAEGQTVLATTRERARGTMLNTVNRLAKVGAIDAGDLSVSLSVRVRCEQCGTSEPIDAFLEEGGCNCDG